jgi:uncharacterized protein (DUF2252 family)
MARSVHAYVRGNTGKFYEWLAASDAAKAIPVGPSIWICGDCHLGNLGPLADSDRHVDIQIRDLDQTVIGNPALDLIRLGLSLEAAARSSDLPGVTTARMVEAMIDGYLRALSPRESDDPVEPDVVKSVRRTAVGRRWKHLARERIGGEDDPRIPIGKRFWALGADERDGVHKLFDDRSVRDQALALAGLGPKGRLRVVDAAYWRKGCSSLGRLRYAVLLGVAKSKSAPEYLALVDIKEATPSIAPAASAANVPSDPAERVVAGARALSPNLGDRMIAARLFNKPVVIRELAPQDLKIEVDQFSRAEAVAAAGYLAFVVGVAHARQLDDKARIGWSKMLAARPEQNLEAPSWLWRSIVDLAAAHEAGYLEHCRKFAMSGR